MNEEIENPPAFPVTIPGDEKAGWQPEHIEGMTLRDYFAAKIVTATINAYGFTIEKTNDWHAEKAYVVSDAMLKARLK